MDAGTMIRSAREAAGLSKRELARRAGTSAAALVEYESGRRDPTTATLLRIIRAAGGDVRLVASGRPSDEVQGRRLLEVLRLAAQLPTRPAARTVPYPRFPS
ncbi:MAG: helix-turn-helix transcriptional regulator [Acidimicrobiales bacterium]|nr:helix-turn-helix transcriptional regulator [Acidimicrobiales bacterium]